MVARIKHVCKEKRVTLSGRMHGGRVRHASFLIVLLCSYLRWLRGDGGADPDGLDVDEFADAEGGEFPAIAAALDAAEGEARVGCSHAVDEDAARFEVPGQGAP